jgi:hypothetical protein
VVIHDLNIVRVALMPAETDAPLVINPDAPSASAVAFQRLQPIPRENTQIFQPSGMMQHPQFPQCDRLHGVI